MAVPNWAPPEEWPLLRCVTYCGAPAEAVTGVGAAAAVALSMRITFAPPRAPPQHSWDATRAQRSAAALLGDLAGAAAHEQERAALTLGITSDDLAAPEVPFALGGADASRRVALLSLRRLQAPAAEAEAAHQCAHALGVRSHCYEKDARCVMRFAGARERAAFCARHAAEVRHALLGR
jgi:predicted Zn-dependent protease